MHGGWDLAVGDCRRVLASLAPASVDVVVTDPPWNYGKPYGAHDDAMPPGAYRRWLGEVLMAADRVSRRGVVCFLDVAHLALLPDLAVPVAGLLTWQRHGGGREPILWFATHPPQLDARAVGRTQGRLHGSHPDDGFAGCHPCPKPVSAVRPLVELFAPPRGTVLDPFCGIGSHLVAALEAGCRAVGVEREPRFAALAVRRCREVALRMAAGDSAQVVAKWGSTSRA